MMSDDDDAPVTPPGAHDADSAAVSGRRLDATDLRPGAPARVADVTRGAAPRATYAIVGGRGTAVREDPLAARVAAAR